MNADTLSAADRQARLSLWLMAGMTGLCALGIAGMLALLVRGSVPYFWPTELVQFSVQREAGEEVELLAGRIVERKRLPAEYLRAAGEEIPDGVDWVERYYVKTGNRDLYGLDFAQLLSTELIGEPQRPRDLFAVERRQWGDFYGYLLGLERDGQSIAAGDEVLRRLDEALPQVRERHSQAQRLRGGGLGDINRELEELNLRLRSMRRDGASAAAMRLLEQRREQLQRDYQQAERQLNSIEEQSRRFVLLVRDAAGEQQQINLAEVVRLYSPNELGFGGKLRLALAKLWEFLSEEPREANTEGGVFPAIFGTVSMVFVMSVLVTPFGVATAFYLHEYRRQGFFVRLIRICINNLAGVPSIVFGIFGLGFFVYSLGGSLDQLLFSDRLPNPTLGTPGLFWASLTLALLTLPVVVVSTEEGLARVPKNIRHGALALGATRFEMLSRTVLPMAIPGILTGVILAVARAAGEVAPLMLVGAVKFAPDLPIDGQFPYLHLEQKFMHLGLHIYDAGFQSPNSEAALPLVYASSLLLLVVILVLNTGATWLRQRYRQRMGQIEV